jgi:dinuclear metal center YbgI/SA1388 family protein
MNTKVSDIIRIVNEIAPEHLAMKEDKVGLQVGGKDASVNHVLVTLDVNESVLQEAIDINAQLIVSHHPVIFDELKTVVDSEFVGRIIKKAIKNDISIYVAHTNLDKVIGGVSDVLAEILGLMNIEILFPDDIKSDFYKLVVFVPPENIDEVSDAICKAGAGIIGDYDYCTFKTKGTGAFRAGKNTNPAIGETGKYNQVEEYRLETLVEKDRIEMAISAMLKTHPYEEVAYDIYEVKEFSRAGLGRIGDLEEETLLTDCIKEWSLKLGNKNLKVSNDLNRKVKRVAVCGGAGGDLISIAKSKGADMFVSGDIKYHTALSAASMGIALVDAGHDFTEKLIVPKLADEVRLRCERLDFGVKVSNSKIDTNPWSSA